MKTRALLVSLLVLMALFALTPLMCQLAKAQTQYSVTIWAWDYVQGWQRPVKIYRDGVDTGFTTPQTFFDQTGTHTYTVPKTNSEGHPFSDWDVGGNNWTDTTITINSGGTYTARYRAGYSVTIWGWDYIEGWARPVQITKDGAPTGFSTPHTFTDLTGTHTFAVPYSNSAGHPFSDWSNDWTDPTLTVSSAGVYTARYREGYSITVKALLVDQYYISRPITLDGSYTGFSTPHTFPGLTGTHTIEVPGYDEDGHPFYGWNEGSSSSPTLTVNSAGVFTAKYRIPPYGSIVINGGATYTTSTSVTLSLTYQAALGTTEVTQVRYSNDDEWDTEVWESPAASKAWVLASASGDGVKAVYFQVKDSWGLVSPTYSDTIVLHMTPPTAEIIINNGAAYTNSTLVNIDGFVSLEQTWWPPQVRLSNDGTWDTESWQYPPWNVWTLTPGDGLKTVYFQVKDNAGLVSPVYSDTIILDTAPPTGSVLINGGAAYTTSTSVTLSLTYADVTSGVSQARYSNDGASWTPWEAPALSKSWTLTSGDGTKTVHYQIKDNAGLTSTTYIDTITLQTGSPGSLWNIQTVDSVGNVGRYPSLAMDAYGNPHISYCDDTNVDLKYAKWTGTTWSIQAVDSAENVGSVTSLALAYGIYPCIAYSTNAGLKFARWNGSAWNIQIAEAGVAVGSISLTLDTNSNPCIGYLEVINADLKFARWTGTTWSIQTVDSAGYVGLDLSLAIDYEGTPYISYSDVTNYDLKFARWTGTTWNIQTVDPSGGVGTSIAIDYSNSPCIAYSGSTGLKFARWTGSTWNTQTVDSTPSTYTSLAIDVIGNPCISYYDYTNKDLKYAIWTGSAWNIQTVDAAGDVGYYSSLAFDGSGHPCIGYWDSTSNDLKYAHGEFAPPTGSVYIQGTAYTTSTSVTLSLTYTAYGSTVSQVRYSNDGTWDTESWESPAQTKSWSLTPGDGTKFVYYQIKDNSGLISKTYFDSIILQTQGSTWTIKTADSTGNVGTYSSLKLDSGGNPCISYHDAGNGDLKFARWTGTTWNIQTVDSEGYAGLLTSLALDSSGNPYISYWTNTNLKLAKWTGSSWNIQTVDSGAGSFSDYTCLALDSSGTPCISYSAGGNLKFARWTGTTWNIQTVDSEGYARYSSLALNSAGNPCISYSAGGNLKFARWTGTTWNIQTVDSEGYATDTSLALDSSGNPYISYIGFLYGHPFSYLKFARWTGTTWNIQTVDKFNPAGTDGCHTSLALDSSGNPCISTCAEGVVRFCRWTGSAWSVQAVDSLGGAASSLAFDANGNPHVSFCSLTNSVLKYAYSQFATPADTTPPTGSVIINGGAATTNSAGVVLTLSATDPESGVSQIRFSNDGSLWSSWETYSASKSWTLTSGDGTKTAYVQFKNGEGLSSATYSDSITLQSSSSDTTPPTGSITINGGAATTNTATVTLTLQATDNSGTVAQMRFANLGESWTTWELYATSKVWTLTPGTGTKTVLAQFKDGSNIESAPYGDTILFDSSFEEKTFNVTVGTSVYPVNTRSNSTVSDFSFNQALKRIRFSVNGTAGTSGFCNITVPAELISGDFSLFMDDSQLVKDAGYTQAYNGTHYTFSFSHGSGVHAVEIFGTNVIPEFPSAVMLILLVTLASALALMVRGKLKPRRQVKTNGVHSSFHIASC